MHSLPKNQLLQARLKENFILIYRCGTVNLQTLSNIININIKQHFFGLKKLMDTLFCKKKKIKCDYSVI